MRFTGREKLSSMPVGGGAAAPAAGGAAAAAPAAEEKKGVFVFYLELWVLSTVMMNKINTIFRLNIIDVNYSFW